MSYQRSIMAGMTDYTGVAIGDIVEHLRDWKAGTEQTITKLHALRQAVEDASDRLHNPAGITGYIDHFANLFSRFAAEFDRLVSELPSGVRQSHADAVRAVYDSARLEEALCVQFNRDHIQRYIEDDNLRHNVVDAIYGETRDLIVDYFDLSNLAPRLQALAGNSPDMRKPSTSQDHFKWAWFVFGCVFVLFALGLVAWAFYLKTLTGDQRFLLMWLLPIASGFACGCFAGGVTAKGPVGPIVVAATGGFAVWLLTYFLLKPHPRHFCHLPAKESSRSSLQRAYQKQTTP